MLMSKIIFNTVIIEVTRRCNMRCPHCLRGDAQNIDIDLEILDRFLSNFKDGFIREMLFTGGEPSLNPEAIKFTLDTIKKYNITVQYFTMITNGKNFSNEIVSIVNSAGNFGVLLSLDSFHDKLTDEDYKQLSRVKNIMSKEYNSGESENPEHSIRRIGRAKENNIGRITDVEDDLIFSSYHNNYILVSHLVCTCLGDVLKNCNYSFYDDDILSALVLCDYDDDIQGILQEEAKNSYIHSLEGIVEKGSLIYKFFNFLRLSGVRI